MICMQKECYNTHTDNIVVFFLRSLEDQKKRVTLVMMVRIEECVEEVEVVG